MQINSQNYNSILEIMLGKQLEYECWLVKSDRRYLSVTQAELILGHGQMIQNNIGYLLDFGALWDKARAQD